MSFGKPVLKMLRGRQFWAKGYCVSTVGLDEGIVREYIRNQEEEEKRQDEHGIFSRLSGCHLMLPYRWLFARSGPINFLVCQRSVKGPKSQQGSKWYRSIEASVESEHEFIQVRLKMLLSRGLSLVHTMIMRWVHQYAAKLDKRVRPHLKKTGDSLRVDETYVKVKEVSQQ